ncbi:hypothetical protein QBC47DRAFT_302792 [Echria macrotheca]|uniref:Uncharacterized protein n=1 Tax=Echria macrotheca TaxID=438768 RepID=A0AAJ0B9M9_9PEZI|nr:hypothetical protein QBC47DRAFT_302792 [Echria macrotheca]
MAPRNGDDTAGKPAKVGNRRAASKVVPVIPLTYPQRPVSKQGSATQQSSPIQEHQPRHEIAESHGELSLTNAGESQEHNGGKPEAGQTLELAHAQDNAQAALFGSCPPLVLIADLAQGTPTVIAGLPSSSGASANPTHVGLPTTNGSGLRDAIHAQPVMPPHPGLAFRHFHQARPSNGSMMFGGFQGSNNTSPAPHSGSGFVPPEMLPCPPSVPLDGYGRPLLISPTADGYPPQLGHHAPPTPHSFQGSQSSAPVDDHRPMNPYAAVSGTNGYPTSHHSGVSLSANAINGHGNGPVPPAGPVALPGSDSVWDLRNQEEALMFVRNGIDSPTFSDCILEVRFSENTYIVGHPDSPRLRSLVRIPAHRFILSRSPTLLGVLKSQNVGAGGVLCLDIAGDHMRSDVFWYVLRTLYGWTFGNGFLPSDLSVLNVVDDLNLALCYIDMGNYLQLPWVQSTAVRRAIQLICWETLETAVTFTLRRVMGASRIRRKPVYPLQLLDHLLVFIIKNFPRDFVLDVNVTAGNHQFKRLPADIAQPPPSPPPIANGSSGSLHSRQPSRAQGSVVGAQRLPANPRLSKIKFGDISPERNGLSPDDEAEAPRRRAPTHNETILSQIILNLPYEHLKQVLEDPSLGGMPGELDPSARFSIISEIIAEREARRMRTLDPSQEQLKYFQQVLRDSAAPLVVEQMEDLMVNNMGYKEEVCSGDGPFLVHSWTHSESNSANVSV